MEVIQRMGDFKTDIKIQITYLSRKYKYDAYINYSPDDNGVPYAVTEFFSDTWDKMKEHHDDIVYKADTERREAEEKEKELAELKRLKEKYEGKSAE